MKAFFFLFVFSWISYIKCIILVLIFNSIIVFLKQIETDDQTALVSKLRNKGGKSNLASAGFNIINSIIGSGIIGKCIFFIIHPCLYMHDYSVLRKAVLLFFWCCCWRFLSVLLLCENPALSSEIRSHCSKYPSAFSAIMTGVLFEQVLTQVCG